MWRGGRLAFALVMLAILTRIVVAPVGPVRGHGASRALAKKVAVVHGALVLASIAVLGAKQ